MASLALVLAVFFWVLGAPLISALLAAQVLLVAVSFAYHALHAADGETLHVQGGCLWVEQRQGLARRQDSFELAALRVAQGEGGLIELRVQRRCLEIGRFADVVQRQRILSAMRQALRHPALVEREQT